ncbi:MAG: hypothetical protein METHP_01980 [Methanoregula sp. SKADARSKE-2]|nr:MAG: hypothetical protein METHP_01980 [Methanoregula sp. SKADARSKE-2]
MVGQGAKTTPSLLSAMAKIHYSAFRGSRTSARSPLLIPYFRRAFAAWLERFARSRRLYFFSSPFWSTQIIASLFRSFFAQLSIRSNPKLKYSGTSLETVLFISS